ncbi:MAG: FUSC family protein [Acidimicrobiia bacterium]
MTTNSEGILSQLFPWNPSGLNLAAGVKLFVFALVAGAITIFADVNLVPVIIGALLAWLTDIPGTTANRVVGFVAYGILGSLLVWLATSLDTIAGFTLAMFAVGALLTLPMAVSSRAFMVGWSSIILFIQANNIVGSGEVLDTIWRFLAGVVVIVVTLIWPKGKGPWGSSGDNPPPESGANEDRSFVGVYALTVGVALAAAAYIGMNQFDFGVQMLATSVFMVLGPTTQQKWITAAGRAVAVVAGIGLSFVLINAIDSLEVLTIVWAIFPAIAVATLGVSLAFALGAYTTQMMMTIVLLGGNYEAFALDSNNRLVAEAIGIAIAVLAALFLEWWSKQRQVDSFVNSEFDDAEVAA